MRLPEAGHGAWHTDRQVTEHAEALDHVAVLVEIHVAIRRGRRRLAIIDERILAIHADQHEAAAADVAGFGIGHCQGETGRDAGVDCIATCREDALADVGTVAIRHSDGGIAQDRGFVAGRGRLGRRRTGGEQTREDGDG